MLDKSQIKRVLKDHCGRLTDCQIIDDTEIWREIIAQILIEHESEIIKKDISEDTLYAFLEKLNAKEPKTEFPLFKAMEICKFALKK